MDGTGVTLVQPYDRAWPRQFREIKGFLESGLSGIDCVFEHVGSTAIPGMVAKPIIDIDIVIAPGRLWEVTRRLEGLGYVHQGDLGISGREAFDLVDLDARNRLAEHHLYVCEEGAFELRKHLVFRDFLKKHPEWRERLSALKGKLCIQYNNDRQAYIEGKAELVMRITELAFRSVEEV